jgi:hypothetical protein
MGRVKGSIGQVTILIGLVFLGLVMGSLSSPSNSLDPAEFKEFQGKSEEELKRLLDAYQGEIRQMKTKEKKGEEGRLVKAVARDLVDHSYREPDLKLRKIQLELAKNLTAHPEEELARLKKETQTKKEADALLKRVLNETNPDIQEKLLIEAENKVYWLETGKILVRKVKSVKVPQAGQTSSIKNTKKSRGQKKVKSTTTRRKKSKKTKTTRTKRTRKVIKKKSTVSIEKVEEARTIAIELVRESHNMTSETTRNEYLSLAYDLLHDPLPALERYYSMQHQQYLLHREADVLMKRVFTYDNETIRMQLIHRLDKFLADPFHEIQSMQDADIQKDYAQAKSLATDLLEQAKVDTNPATQEVKIQAARQLMLHPLQTMTRMRTQQAEDHLQLHVPPQCHQTIHIAFERKLSNLEVWDIEYLETMIEETVEERELIFSQGGDWEQEISIEAKALGPSDICLARSPSRAGDQLLSDTHLDSLLADTFASFLQQTYARLAATPLPSN